MNIDERICTFLISSILAASAAGCAATPLPVAAPTVAAPAALPELRGGGDRCVTIQRGVHGDVHDTRVSERWADRSYGTQTAAPIGRVGAAETGVLVRFELGDLPPNAVVTRAVMTLQSTTNAPAPATVSAHQVTSRWTEQCTWKSFTRAYEPEPAASALVTEGASGAIALDITALARGWLRGDSENHGVVVRQDVASAVVATSEAESIGLRPRLEVCFANPATPSPAAPGAI